MPGSAQSAAYAVAATTLSRASCRATGWPTTRSASRAATASAIAAAFRSHVRLDGVDDLGVARAAAEVALQRGADRRTIGPRLALEEREDGEEHARGAEAALHGAVTHEGLLQRVQAAVALDPAQRRHGPSAQGRRQHEAARRRPAVEQHRADAAHALVTALLDVEDAERVAQHLEQRLVGAHLDLARPSVEHQARDHARPSARATARARARRQSTPATRRRYAPDTNASDGGSSASRAAWAARAIDSVVGSRPRRASSAARAWKGRSATPPKATRASSTPPRRARDSGARARPILPAGDGARARPAGAARRRH